MPTGRLPNPCTTYAYACAAPVHVVLWESDDHISHRIQNYHDHHDLATRCMVSHADWLVVSLSVGNLVGNDLNAK
jgi:hypothetical protein